MIVAKFGLTSAGPAGKKQSQGEPPRVAAVVLAAGQSTRMSGDNKLLCPDDGKPMIARVVDAACTSRCAPVLVVTGHQAKRIEEAIGGRPVSIVYNADYCGGLSTSLRCAVNALPIDVQGALIMLGDMPFVSTAAIDRLLDAFAGTSAIVAPQRDGRRGNPVLWPRRHFARLGSLHGDCGGRNLIEELAAEVLLLPVDDDAIFTDIDTRAELAELDRR